MRSYLEVTYRKGKPLAAYWYLPRKPGDFSARTMPSGSGLNIDFAEDGRPIGVEVSAPGRITLELFNQVLERVQQPPATADDLAPLLTSRHRVTSSAGG